MLKLLLRSDCLFHLGIQERIAASPLKLGQDASGIDGHPARPAHLEQQIGQAKRQQPPLVSPDGRPQLGEGEEEADYVVAVDDARKTFKAYMEAYGQNGIPTSFVVDKQGQIVWVGHPMGGLDEALTQVLATSLDARDVFGQLAEAVKPILDFDVMGALLISTSGRDLELLAKVAPPDMQGPPERIPLEHYSFTRKVEAGDAVVIQDALVELDPSLPGDRRIPLGARVFRTVETTQLRVVQVACHGYRPPTARYNAAYAVAASTRPCAS